MAVERVYRVSGQEIVPTERVTLLQPGQRYYYADRTPLAPVEIVQTQAPRTVYVLMDHSAMPPIVSYRRASHDGAYLLLVAVVMLLLMLVALLTVVLMSWIAMGRLPLPA